MLTKSLMRPASCQQDVNIGGRLDWVDVSKGLGLVLVIFGHLLYNGTWDGLNKAIYSFHMPMYFILSGYIARRQKENILAYIKRKANELLLPAFCFIVLTIPIYLYQVKSDDIGLCEITKTILFVKGQISYNAPVWFLIVMFQVVVMFYLIRAIDFSITLKLLSALLCFATGYMIYTYNIELLFGFEKTIIALGFYFIGCIMAYIVKKFAYYVKLVTFCTSVIMWLIMGCLINSKVSFYTFSLGNYFCFIISGIAGSIMWFGVCWALRRIVLFQTWGQNTILVVGTHYIGVSIVNSLARKLGFANTIYFDIAALIISISVMFLYMPICRFFNKYLPFLNGRRTKRGVICKE